MSNFEENDPILGLFDPHRMNKPVYCCGVIPMVSIVGLAIINIAQIKLF